MYVKVIRNADHGKGHSTDRYQDVVLPETLDGSLRVVKGSKLLAIYAKGHWKRVEIVQ